MCRTLILNAEFIRFFECSTCAHKICIKAIHGLDCSVLIFHHRHVSFPFSMQQSLTNWNFSKVIVESNYVVNYVLSSGALLIFYIIRSLPDFQRSFFVYNLFFFFNFPFLLLLDDFNGFSLLLKFIHRNKS